MTSQITWKLQENPKTRAPTKGAHNGFLVHETLHENEKTSRCRDLFLLSRYVKKGTIFQWRECKSGSFSVKRDIKRSLPVYSLPRRRS